MPTKIMEAVDTTADTPIIAAKEDAVRNSEEIGTVEKAVKATVIWHTTIGLMECALVWAKTTGTQQNSKIGRDVVQQDFGEWAELHLKGRVDICK